MKDIFHGPGWACPCARRAPAGVRGRRGGEAARGRENAHIDRGVAHTRVCMHAASTRAVAGREPVRHNAENREVGESESLCAVATREDAPFGVEDAKADAERHGLPLLAKSVRASGTVATGQHMRNTLVSRENVR